jgi:hypothetical protein
MSPEQQAVGEAVSFVATVNDVIIFPLIALLTGIAFLVFLYGCAEYILNASNEQGRKQGTQHVMYGIIGLVVMLSAWSILQIATATFGLNDELDCARTPSASGCAEKFDL